MRLPQLALFYQPTKLHLKVESASYFLNSSDEKFQIVKLGMQTVEFDPIKKKNIFRQKCGKCGGITKVGTADSSLRFFTFRNEMYFCEFCDSFFGNPVAVLIESLFLASISVLFLILLSQDNGNNSYSGLLFLFFLFELIYGLKGTLSGLRALIKSI